MTKVILVRHGHVEGINPARFRGRRELPLTPLGRRQAELTAQRVASAWRPIAIYTSPMGRCVETATAIGVATSVNVEPEPRLIDIDCGAWQGLTPEEARSRWPDELTAWYRTPHLATLPEGETLQGVLARTAAAIKDIVRRHPGEVVVLVGHDSVNRVVLLHTLDLSLSHYWRLKQDPCAINELEFTDGEFIVRTINETWHLSTIDAVSLDD